MPIPELELARVKRTLDKFCDRIPLHVRPNLTNLYRFDEVSMALPSNLDEAKLGEVGEHIDDIRLAWAKHFPG